MTTAAMEPPAATAPASPPPVTATSSAPPPPALLDTDTLRRLNEEFETAPAEDIIAWTFRTFPGQVYLTTAWQRNGMAVLDMALRHDPAVPVLFIDTGYHFPETLSYALDMTVRMKLNLVVCKPAISRRDFEAAFGAKLHDTDPDKCCAVNKVEPLRRETAKLGRRVWLTGLRRDQSSARAATPVLQAQPDGTLKVNPLVRWSSRDVWRRLQAAGIPDHPLYDAGYASIGCAPESCTRPVTAGQDERAGRWSGKGKAECGIHTFQI